MKITKGFVAVLPDGRFLRIHQVSTMVGYRPDVDIVADIEQATVQPVPRVIDRSDRLALEQHKFTWCPVEVRREVILKGYGT
jgi:hypothetical protein